MLILAISTPDLVSFKFQMFILKLYHKSNVKFIWIYHFLSLCVIGFIYVVIACLLFLYRKKYISNQSLCLYTTKYFCFQWIKKYHNYSLLIISLFAFCWHKFHIFLKIVYVNKYVVLSHKTYRNNSCNDRVFHS